MVNKRGQEMTLGTIVVIILGIAVLVFLIFGFSTGWNNLWDKASNFGGSSSGNSATIKQGCDIACTAGDVDAYCHQRRTVKFPEKVAVVGGSTEQCLGEVGDKKNLAKSCVATCKELADSSNEEITKIGVSHCSTIDC